MGLALHQSLGHHPRNRPLGEAQAAPETMLAVMRYDHRSTRRASCSIYFSRSRRVSDSSNSSNRIVSSCRRIATRSHSISASAAGGIIAWATTGFSPGGVPQSAGGAAGSPPGPRSVRDSGEAQPSHGRGDKRLAWSSSAGTSGWSRSAQRFGTLLDGREVVGEAGHLKLLDQ